MAMKHGYNSVEEYKAGAQKKFSLLETGVIQKPSTRLLLINVRLTVPFSLFLSSCLFLFLSSLSNSPCPPTVTMNHLLTAIIIRRGRRTA